MHEHHQVKALVRQVFLKAKNEKASKVKKVWIVLGEATGYKEESVRHYFNAFTKGSVAEGAKLVFLKTKTRLYCENCENEFVPKKGLIHCPSCRALGQLRRSANEFYVESIRIQTKKPSG